MFRAIELFALLLVATLIGPTASSNWDAIRDLVNNRSDPKTGAWDIPAEQIELMNKQGDGSVLYFGPPRFIYTGASVGMRFVKIKAPGGIEYAWVKSKFRNNKLYYCHADREWVFLADYDPNHRCFFLVEDFNGKHITWKYTRLWSGETSLTNKAKRGKW
jgi:hypothetical protein